MKPGWTRVSFPYYTAPEEMEFVVDAIELIASHGRRFLPLYNFDWRTGDWEYSHHLKISQPLKILEKSTVGKRIYADYMAVARCTAEALPGVTAEGRSIPGYIDPQLVNFTI